MGWRRVGGIVRRMVPRGKYPRLTSTPQAIRYHPHYGGTAAFFAGGSANPYLVTRDDPSFVFAGIEADRMRAELDKQILEAE
jgi:hypothetical protein